MMMRFVVWVFRLHGLSEGDVMHDRCLLCMAFRQYEAWKYGFSVEGPWRMPVPVQSGSGGVNNEVIELAPSTAIALSLEACGNHLAELGISFPPDVPLVYAIYGSDDDLSNRYGTTLIKDGKGFGIEWPSDVSCEVVVSKLEEAVKYLTAA